MRELSDTRVPPNEEKKIYEGQRVELAGFVWKEAFPGPPNYESLETDSREVCWMLVIKDPVTLIASSMEDQSSYEISGVRRLQMMLTRNEYEEKRSLVLSNALVKGKLWPTHTRHHHGDALVEVESLEAAAA